MPQGSRTNYKGHWSKEEVSCKFQKLNSYFYINLNLKLMSDIGSSFVRGCKKTRW